jgi:hypothetical protein
MVPVDQAAAQAILLELPLVSEAQTRMLHAAWQGGDVAVRKRAWQHGKQALKAHQAEDTYEEANSAVGRWIRDYATGRLGMVADIADFSFMDQDRLSLRITAAPPILDAILGSLTDGLIPADETAELLGPWRSIMGVAVADGATDLTEPDTRGDAQP